MCKKGREEDNVRDIGGILMLLQTANLSGLVKIYFNFSKFWSSKFFGKSKMK